MTKYQVFLASKYEVSRLQDDAYLESVKRDFNIITTTNSQIFNDLNQKWNTMLSLAADVYGKGTVAHKYILNRKPAKPPDNWAEFNKLLKRYNTWFNKEQKRLEEIRVREEEAERQRDYRRRRSEALEILIEQEYIPDQHFAKGRAITFARKVIYQLPDGTIAPRALPSGEE